MSYTFKVGDRVIVKEHGSDYGKMCTIIEASETNDELLVRIRLVNTHDYFKVDDILCSDRTEKWISRANIQLYIEKESS